MSTAWMKRHSMNFFLKNDFLYAPMKYRILEILIQGQFCTYLEFRGEKYLNTFIVTNANDCPYLLSYGATFRMGVLLPNYLEENVVKGDNVPNFSKAEYRQNRKWYSTWYITWYAAWYLLCQHLEWYSEHYTGWYIQCLPDPAGHTEKMKSCTVPVQFQYGTYGTRDRNSFQDHHTLCTSNDSNWWQIDSVHVHALQRVDLQHTVHMSTSHQNRFANQETC